MELMTKTVELTVKIAELALMSSNKVLTPWNLYYFHVIKY